MTFLNYWPRLVVISFNYFVVIMTSEASEPLCPEGSPSENVILEISH